MSQYVINIFFSLATIFNCGIMSADANNVYSQSSTLDEPFYLHLFFKYREWYKKHKGKDIEPDKVFQYNSKF